VLHPAQTHNHLTFVFAERVGESEDRESQKWKPWITHTPLSHARFALSKTAWWLINSSEVSQHEHTHKHAHTHTYSTPKPGHHTHTHTHLPNEIPEPH